jgi:hypothetical protein
MQKAADYNDEFEKFTMMCTQVHPTIKRLWRGALGFTIYKTFSIYFSCRKSPYKYTQVHPMYNRPESDAITPCHLLVIIAFMAFIFFYALGITKGVVA